MPVNGGQKSGTRFIKMATAEATAFFVIKFDCFTNRAYNKKAIKEVELNSSIGNVVSSLYEDENVTVSSVLMGERENNVTCSADLNTPFSVIQQFGHKYINVDLKETIYKYDENNNQQPANIFKVMMACKRTYESYPPERYSL